MRPARILLACLILLCACDSPSKQAGSPPPRIFDTQRNALDKAKGVQDTLNRAAEQQRRQADQ